MVMINSWEDLESLVKKKGDGFPIYWVDTRLAIQSATIRKRIVKQDKKGGLLLFSDNKPYPILASGGLKSLWWYSQFEGDAVFLNFWEAYGYCRRHNWPVTINDN